MTEHEQDKFEAALRHIKPAKLPEELVARLRKVDLSSPVYSPQVRSMPLATPGFLHLLRWLFPATAVVLIAVAVWRNQQPATQQLTPENTPPVMAATTPPTLKPDNIEIGKELVSSFDAVATLPGGEPVRFRCQRWMDQVVVNDKSRGLLVENRTPRVVVVPVGFETY